VGGHGPFRGLDAPLALPFYTKTAPFHLEEEAEQHQEDGSPLIQLEVLIVGNQGDDDMLVSVIVESALRCCNLLPR
jgi:hypothetical protein